MQNISQEQIDKRFQTLSDALQETIFSQQSADVIQKTCVLREAEKHTTVIAKFTGSVLLGYLRPENFASEIQKETGMDAEKAGQIAHDLDTEIFSAVRLELKKLYPPTIQTPTVQSPGFTAAGTSEAKVSGLKIQDQRPRYVIPIPEKFLKQGSGIMEKTAQAPVRFSPAPPPPAQPIVQPIIQQTTQPVTQPIVRPVIQPVTQPIAPPATTKQPEPVIKATPATTPSEPSSVIKPVVPLPTFIHTKFKSGDHE